MPGKAKRMVGLSIGSRAIAVAQIHMDISGVIAVERLGVLDIPPGAIDYSGVADTEAVSRAIQDLLVANDIQYRKMALAISENSVITRLLTLPSMSGNEMREVLKGEVENYAILAGEEPALDFHIADQTTESIRRQTEVLVVAATEDLLNSYTATMEAANVRLSVVETIPLAILRIPTHHQSEDGMRNTTMLVSIEENGGTIIVVRDGIILFIHSIESGSNRLSEESGALEELTDELRSSLSYYQMTFPQNGEIEDIVVFMNGGNTDRVCDGLGRSLDMPVVAAANASPLLKAADAHIQDRAMDYGLSSYAAIGAAARSMAGASDVSIDILHPKRFQASGLRRKTLKLLLWPLSIILLSVCANIFLNAGANSIMNRVLTTRQSEGDSETQTLQTLREIASLKADRERLEAQVYTGKAITDSSDRMDWIQILREISEIIPKTMWLSDLTWEKDEDATFDGFAVSHESIFMFRDKLTGSPYFDSVRLISLRASKIGVRSFIQFEILCRVRRKAEG